MKPTSIVLICLTALLLVAAVHLGWAWPRLPERVPSHFTGDGRVDGWSARTAFVWSWGGTVLLTTGLCVGLALIVGRLPDRLLSLPHADYWLTPRRRAAALEKVRLQLLTLAVLVQLFLLDVQLQMIAVALGHAETLTRSGLDLALLTTATLGWTVLLAASFRRPAGAQAALDEPDSGI